MAVKAKTLDTEIAFRDLTRANKKLRHQQTNPDALRRRFTDFVILSQKLTGVMRKEYADLTSGKWEAKTFPGWNPVTEVFKELRNVDQHQYLIRIIIVQSQVYHAIETTTEGPETGNEKKLELTVQSIYNADAGFEKKLPSPFAVEYFEKEKPTRQERGEMLHVQKRYFEFHLEGRTDEMKELIQAAGTEDVHELVAKCYATLAGYYEYYKAALAANRKLGI